MLDSCTRSKPLHFFLPRNAPGRNDRDYNGESYTYLIALVLILLVELNL